MRKGAIVGISDTTSFELIQIISQDFNTSLNLHEVLGKVLQRMVNTTKAVQASLFLLDREGVTTHHFLVRPNQPPESFSDTGQLLHPDGVAVWVYKNQQGVLVADTETDQRWTRFADAGPNIRSVISVPLPYRERVNGVLLLYHDQANFFTKRHLTLATSIAGQAAVSIENARLFTHIKGEQESLVALSQGVPLPIIVIVEGKIVFYNKAAERDLMIKRTGVPLAHIEGGVDLETALTELQETNQHSLDVTWPDGRIFHVSMNEVQPYGTVLSLDDVTYLKKLSEMKSQFVETVSHDLKNPLSMIKGFARMLHYENLSDQGRINLEHIAQSVDHMEALVNNLLDLAQIEAGMGGATEHCNLVDITKGVLEDYVLRFEKKGLQLHSDLPTSVPRVSANPVRLREVVVNLVSNAIKYTPENGEIFVTIKQTDTEVLFKVTDTGRGIPPASHPQLFEKFYRVPITDASQWVEGTGLGLSIVKAIVEEYGGRVWVESELGVGSTFGCTFPIV